MTEKPFRESIETAELLKQAEQGERAGIDELLSLHRERLRRMVQLRMPQNLKRRIDASDVIQDAFIEASRRLDEYLEKRSMPFFLWLRFLTRQTLMTLYRHHVGTQARDPRREIDLDPVPAATSEALAAQLMGQLTTPSQAAVKAEMKSRLHGALDDLDPREREILALRHFEQLSNAEAAAELGIKTSAASKRYLRAITRFRGVLVSLNIDPTSHGTKSSP